MAAVSKLIIEGRGTIFDLTADTVTAEKLLVGETAHGADGEPITGTCEYDVDTKELTALEAEVIAGKTFAARGTVITGTMPNNESYSATIKTVDGSAAIPSGYHDGGGSVTIDSDEIAKIIPANIKAGVSMLGVVGTYGGEEIKAQVKNYKPTLTGGTVLPDPPFDYLSEVRVEAVPIVYLPNAAGGMTVTIG